MPPRTRRARQAHNNHMSMGLNNTLLSDTMHANVVDRVGDEGQPLPVATHPRTKAIAKRTFPTQDESTGTSTSFPEEMSTPVKRARVKARVANVNSPSRLVQLMTGEDMTRQPSSGQEDQQCVEQRTAAALQRKASFYPGLNVDSILDVQSDNLAEIPDEAHFEDEEDWICIPTMSELSRGRTSKFSESVMKEPHSQRPSWKGSHPASGLHAPSSIIFGGDKRLGSADTSLGQATTSMAPAMPSTTETTVSTEVSVAASLPMVRQACGGVPARSPSDGTDLCFVPGTTRILLNSQHPVIYMVITEAIENIQHSLLFTDAFPDLTRAAEFIRDGLLTGAVRQGAAGAAIHKRLREDEDYLSAITPLPRARISIFRAEVKECCNMITTATFLAMLSQERTQTVEEQLSNYNYTFPKVLKNFGHGTLVMRSRPYRNDWIITVIRDLYFNGGHMSFANRYRYLFPRRELSDNVLQYEVPMPMVALVATVLYAVIYEWRMGKQQIADFSTNSYLDVYRGHIDTMKEILDKRSGAFHAMMADIYSQASSSSESAISGITADINFEDLED
ncbi:hypothetical protein V8E53_000293 [Lactarius tabidus]